MTLPVLFLLVFSTFDTEVAANGIVALTLQGSNIEWFDVKVLDLSDFALP